MKTLDQIRRQVAAGEFEFSRHGLRRIVERNISKSEIQEAGTGMEIIEDYPNDKYSPSVLLLGFTETRRALHLQVSCAETEKTKIITLYEPDSSEWIGFRIRR